MHRHRFVIGLDFPNYSYATVFNFENQAIILTYLIFPSYMFDDYMTIRYNVLSNLLGVKLTTFEQVSIVVKVFPNLSLTNDRKDFLVICSKKKGF